MSQPGKWLKTTETIRFDVSENVARITLNRPDKRNALSGRMLQELHDALLEADDRKDVHAILLEGEGRDFCAGYDLTDSYGGNGPEAIGYDPALYRSRAGTIDDDIWALERQQDLTLIMLDLHKPLIAKVQGNCLAGGTDLAFSCDLVLAAEEAKIGFPAARANGTPPTNLWYYNCGPQWAKRMLFTGDIISGLDAARINMVLDAVPADQLDAEAWALARRVALVDPEILATHKRVINMQMELSGSRLSQRYAAEQDARAHLSQGPRRSRFRQDMAEHGLKEALKNRDEPFGNNRITLHARGRADREKSEFI